MLLVVSLILLLYTYWPILSPYLTKSGAKIPAEAPQPTETPVPTTVSLPSEEARSPEVAETKILSASAEEKAILTDPFALRVAKKSKFKETSVPEAPPEEKPAVKAVGLVLEGIWVDSNMKVAFISGQALGIGDNILGWKVTSISKDQVVLSNGSATKILKMGGK